MAAVEQHQIASRVRRARAHAESRGTAHRLRCARSRRSRAAARRARRSGTRSLLEGAAVGLRPRSSSKVGRDGQRGAPAISTCGRRVSARISARRDALLEHAAVRWRRVRTIGQTRVGPGHARIGSAGRRRPPSSTFRVAPWSSPARAPQPMTTSASACARSVSCLLTLRAFFTHRDTSTHAPGIARLAGPAPTATERRRPRRRLEACALVALPTPRRACGGGDGGFALADRRVGGRRLRARARGRTLTLRRSRSTTRAWTRTSPPVARATRRHRGRHRTRRTGQPAPAGDRAPDRCASADERHLQRSEVIDRTDQTVRLRLRVTILRFPLDGLGPTRPAMARASHHLLAERRRPLRHGRARRVDGGRGDDLAATTATTSRPSPGREPYAAQGRAGYRAAPQREPRQQHHPPNRDAHGDRRGVPADPPDHRGRDHAEPAGRDFASASAVHLTNYPDGRVHRRRPLRVYRQSWDQSVSEAVQSMGGQAEPPTTAARRPSYGSAPPDVSDLAEPRRRASPDDRSSA